MSKSKKRKLDKLSIHEALDRTSVILYTFDDFVVQHSLIQSKKKLSRKANKISTLLHDLYQDIGQVEFSKTNKK